MPASKSSTFNRCRGSGNQEGKTVGGCSHCLPLYLGPFQRKEGNKGLLVSLSFQPSLACTPLKCILKHWDSFNPETLLLHKGMAFLLDLCKHWTINQALLAVISGNPKGNDSPKLKKQLQAAIECPGSSCHPYLGPPLTVPSAPLFPPSPKFPTPPASLLPL